MCSVFRCDSSRRGAQRLKLPKDPEKRLEWVQFVFEANGQRLRESSWTDIRICREHFTEDCFCKSKTGAVQMKSSAVPSLCIKSEPEEQVKPESEEPVDMSEVDSQCDRQQSDSSGESISPDHNSTLDVLVSPVLSQPPEEDYVQMLRKVQNIDIIREKAALLQKKGRYVVNENQLLQLFGSRCPLCDSNVKMEKIIHGGLIIVKRQCLQCKYRHQWKSLIGVQGAEGQHLTYDTKLVSESEESDRMNETEESSDAGTVDSDEDWKPAEEQSPVAALHNGSDETEDDDGEEVDNYYVFAPNHSELCTECGKFFSKRWPHTCEHKVKPYSCNICGKRCVSEVALNRHSRVHNENYEHRCKYCHRTFKTKVDKITHQQVHVTEGKPYKCPDCSETFASNKDREIHLEDHRGPKQLTCPFCGIEFNRTLSIQRHLMVHTGQKPFKCSVCQRGFNQASHLKSHMRLHTGERPFKCQLCEECFNHNVSLKSHVQRYHTSNPARERKRVRKSKTVNTNSQEEWDKRGADPEPGPREEHDEEEPFEKKIKSTPKSKRSTGRPIGRPKRNAEGHLIPEEENQDLGSYTDTVKSQGRKSRRTGGSGEESEDEPPESNMSYDSHEEEDFRSEKATSSPSRSRGSPRMSDFDLVDSKQEQEEQLIEQWNQIYADV